MNARFTKSTDTQHKVTLQSSIIYASWQRGFVHGGSKAGVDIGTCFVGEGAPIKLKAKTEKGKTIGKISDVIRGNHFVGMIPIADSLKFGDVVYFETELPKHGLKEESNHVPAGPPVKVTKMKWDRKEARRGDTVKLTADINGVPDGAEIKVTILEYDADGGHDKIVEIPASVKNKKMELLWEYEYYEDTDEIPTDKELKKYGKSYNPPEYFFVIDVDGLIFGAKQESGILEFKDWIEIELRDSDGDLLPNEDYLLHLPDGQQRKGKSDANGVAIEKDVPPGEVEIEFPRLANVEAQKK
jgi:hypothetical protein